MYSYVTGLGYNRDTQKYIKTEFLCLCSHQKNCENSRPKERKPSVFQEVSSPFCTYSVSCYIVVYLYYFHVPDPSSKAGLLPILPPEDALLFLLPWPLWFIWSFSQPPAAPPPGLPCIYAFEDTAQHRPGNWLLHFSTLWHVFNTHSSSRKSLLLRKVCTICLSLWNHLKAVLPPSLSTHKRIKANYQSNICLYFTLFPLSSSAVVWVEDLEICKFGLILI